MCDKYVPHSCNFQYAASIFYNNQHQISSWSSLGLVFKITFNRKFSKSIINIIYVPFSLNDIQLLFPLYFHLYLVVHISNLHLSKIMHIKHIWWNICEVYTVKRIFFLPCLCISISFFSSFLLCSSCMLATMGANLSISCWASRISMAMNSYNWLILNDHILIISNFIIRVYVLTAKTFQMNRDPQ